MVEIDLRGRLLSRHHAVLRTLNHLGRRIDQSGWCLVGGMMVLVALAERGRVATRSSQTKDADVLVDVCASPKVLSQVVHELGSYGFTPIEPFAGSDFARCTFVGIGGSGQIDVLCPEDASYTDLRSAPGVESLAIPGGRRALEVSKLVTISYDLDEPDVTIRVPLLAGAIVVKAAAAVHPATSNQPRHSQDIVDMLLGLDDPSSERSEMSEEDRSLLQSLSDRMANDGNVAWEGVTARQRNQARAAFDLLVR